MYTKHCTKFLQSCIGVHMYILVLLDCVHNVKKETRCNTPVGPQDGSITITYTWTSHFYLVCPPPAAKSVGRCCLHLWIWKSISSTCKATENTCLLTYRKYFTFFYCYYFLFFRLKKANSMAETLRLFVNSFSWIKFLLKPFFEVKIHLSFFIL